MSKLSRPPLFTVEPGGAQGSAAGSDIFPREVRASVLRVLWLGMLTLLVLLLAFVLAWRTGAV